MKMERRKIFKLLGAAGVTTLLGRPHTALAETKPIFAPPPPDPVILSAQTEIFVQPIQQDSKEQRLIAKAKIDFEKIKPVDAIISEFVGINGLTRDQVLTSFEMYLPFWEAGQIEFKTPTLLLALIHAKESTFSRRTRGSGYEGAMQREPGHSEELIIASKNWEGLAKAPQLEPDDYAQILRAAWFISTNAPIRYPNLTQEEATLQFVAENYSTPDSGRRKVESFKRMQPSFIALGL